YPLPNVANAQIWSYAGSGCGAVTSEACGDSVREATTSAARNTSAAPSKAAPGTITGAVGLTKYAKIPVQIGGPATAVRLIMLATAPCRRPCSFAGSARDIIPIVAGCPIVQPKSQSH